MAKRYIKRPDSYAEWLVMRHQYIGASEMPILSGHNPYVGKDRLMDLWRSKVYPMSLEEAMRMADPQGKIDRLFIGRMVEKVILELFEIDTGIPVRQDHKIWFDPDRPYLACNLDGRAVGEPACVECKNTRSYLIRKYSPDIPPYWYVQVQMQLHLADLEDAYVAILMDNSHFTWRKFTRDTSLYQALSRLGEIFWTEYVARPKEPDPDFWYGEVVPDVLSSARSPYGLSYLRSLRGSPLCDDSDASAAADAQLEALSPEDATSLVEEYMRLKSEIGFMEERLRKVKAHLEVFLKDRGPYQGDGYVVMLEHVTRKHLDKKILESLVSPDALKAAEKEIHYSRIVIKEEVD